MQSRVNLGSKSTCIDIEQQISQGVMDELPGCTAISFPQKELRHCLLKRMFRSRTSLFSFIPPPHFNVVVATKSIGQSNILNIEKGEGRIDGIQCNFIETEGKSTDYS